MTDAELDRLDDEPLTFLERKALVAEVRRLRAVALRTLEEYHELYMGEWGGCRGEQEHVAEYERRKKEVLG